MDPRPQDSAPHTTPPPPCAGGLIVWLTGLSAAGKTTLAHSLIAALEGRGERVYGLDGDDLRAGLNNDLGFSDEARRENVRRTGEVAALFQRAGFHVIVSCISPFREGRAQVRQMAKPNSFVEVFVDTPLAECEARDPKGLYRRARSGDLELFTGISSPYEEPPDADVHLRTAGKSVGACTAEILAVVGPLLPLRDRN